MYRLRLFGGTKRAEDDGKETSAPMIELAYALMFASFGLLVSIVTISSTVCGDNSCITTNAANSAQVQDFGVYNAQLEKMLGVDGDGDTISARCGLNPSHFKVPGNYCQENLIGLPNCPNVKTPGGAEKCLVFACSNLVEGRQSRFVISLVGLLLQIMATYFVILFENTPAAPLAPAVAMGYMQVSAGVPAALPIGKPDGLLKARRRRPLAHYSSRPGKLAF
jgi:hypothetical protein